jgi:aromatic ring-opening dioxygenase catalytic subunit (LigB family)
MSDTETPTKSPLLARRDALALIAGGVAATATAIAVSGSGSNGASATNPSKPDGASTTNTKPDGDPTAARVERMPVVFLPHGGGPWPIVDLGVPKHEFDALARYLTGLKSLTPTPPKALLVISAHWEEPVPTLMTAARPPMLYDYYGFPPASYEVVWAAPGAPELATRVESLLTQANIPSARDANRGFDHGTFIPLMLPFPEAQIPTLQLSLKRGLDPAEHLAIGRALAPLRDEGVLIVGSGMTFHNLRAFFNRSPATADIALRFDTWLRAATTAEPATRDAELAAWSQAPAARQAHPREEHLLPLMVVAGAAGADRGTVAYSDTYMGLRLSAFHFG